VLPPDFIFSQQSLQEYHDCPRRFHLRYIEQLAWPAIESEPVLEQEHLIQLGHDFHLLVQQRLSGIPSETLAESILDDDLQRWWLHFEALDLNVGAQNYFVEEAFTVPIAGYRLLARVDLLLVDEYHKIHIYDWKTSRAEPNRSRLLERAQTKIYPYVIARCRQQISGSINVDPADIRMTYWFPEHPAMPVTFEYSAGKFDSDEQWLTRMIQEIESLAGRDQFPKTENFKLCDTCRFRSLCGRGIIAGFDTGESAADTQVDGFDIDFESL